MLENSGFLSGGGRDNLQVDLAPDLPPVMADRRRIVQVLGNLLSTAARYSPEGSPIRATAVRVGVHVAFSVADEGRGRACGANAPPVPEVLPHRRRRPGERHRRVGVGPGHLQGDSGGPRGRIRAESDGPGQGARFTFTLPAVEEARSGAGTGTSRLSTGSPLGVEGEDPVRILAVDDDPQALRYIRDALSKAGYTPVVTGEPQEAFRLMAAEMPRLVLLDLMLPGADDIELMQSIRSVADVPVCKGRR